MDNRISASLAAPFLLLLLTSIGSAQVQRTFVSGLGVDSNPCSRIAPCRTFGTALMGTSVGGEVVALDSAGYGPFSITHAVSIIAPPGVYAGISVFSGYGIYINAGASDTVILRGLTINDQGTDDVGISFVIGGTLHVEDCVVNGFSQGNGFRGGLIFGAFPSGKLEVKDSIFRGNSFGISVVNPALATIERVRLEGNQYGLYIPNGGSKVTVRNVVASGNSYGLACFTGTPQPVEMNIESCVVSNNTIDGIRVESTASGTGLALARVSNSTVTNNGVGLDNVQNLSTILSRGNNTVQGNTTNTSGQINSYSAK